MSWLDDVVSWINDSKANDDESFTAHRARMAGRIVEVPTVEDDGKLLESSPSGGRCPTCGGCPTCGYILHPGMDCPTCKGSRL